MLLQPLRALLVGGPFDERPHGHVAELGFGLTFELRIGELHRDDRSEAFADVLALEVLLLLLEVAVLSGVAVDGVGERLLEALFVHATFDGGDAVREAVQPVGVVAGVPLEGDFDLHRTGVVRFVLGEVAHVAEQRFLGGVHVPHEVTDSAFVVEFDVVVAVVGAIVAVGDPKPSVEERHHLEPLGERG